MQLFSLYWSPFKRASAKLLACCQIKVHLCYIFSQLIPLHALCKVWLPDSVLQQCEILTVHFSPDLRHQEYWCTHLPGPREHGTWKASIDWYKRDSPASVSQFALLDTNQLKWLSVPCLFLMNPRMFSLSFLPRSRLKTLIQTHSLLEILKLVEWFSGHCRAIKS